MTAAAKSMNRSIPLNDLARHNGPLAGPLTAAMARVLSSGRLILGDQVSAFEREFAAYLGVGHCIGVGNGTDALEIALRALGVGPGDEVLTVANAGMYAACAAVCVGARPVFVDIEPERMTMDPASLAEIRAHSPRAKAVVVTHLYGRMADMPMIEKAAGGLPIIEDCAQAHGARRQDRMAGSFGALACFSFFPTKNLGALGDGGAVVTSDAGLAEDVRRLRQYGWEKKYDAIRAGGRNSRLDEIQAAVLRLKLPLLDGWTTRRRAIVERYRAALPAGAIPATGADDVAHLAVARIAKRDTFRVALGAKNIDTAIHYPVADYRQPAMAAIVKHVSLPETERAITEIVTLPCFPEMTDDEIARAVAVLSSAHGSRP